MNQTTMLMLYIFDSIKIAILFVSQTALVNFVFANTLFERLAFTVLGNMAGHQHCSSLQW